MRRPAALLLLLTALCVPAVAAAEPLTFQPTVANTENLDRDYVYTWRIDGADQSGGLTVGNSNQVITSVRFYFDDSSNWDTAATRLFTHLLDDATGVSAAAEEYTYHYAEAQIVSLRDYILNGNDFALALDPESHFDNDDIRRFIESGSAQQAVPEPAAMLLLGTGLASLFTRRKRPV